MRSTVDRVGPIEGPLRLVSFDEQVPGPNSSTGIAVTPLIGRPAWSVTFPEIRSNFGKSDGLLASVRGEAASCRTCPSL